MKTKRASALLAPTGGKGGIRTLDSLTAILVFETSPFNHSGTSPYPPIIREWSAFENALFEANLTFAVDSAIVRSKYIH